MSDVIGDWAISIVCVVIIVALIVVPRHHWFDRWFDD